MADNFVISIITVCLNSIKHIERCIVSVEEQSYKNIEFIIVDGGSSDGTLDVIGRHKSHISKIISESDSGIYNAMNKGLKCAGGDIIFFLNSDDYFADNNVLSDVIECYRDDPDLEVLYGDQIRTDGNRWSYIKQPDHIGRRTLARRTIQHQTIFVRHKVFNDIGGFDENLRIVSDYLWLLELFLVRKCRYKHIARVITIMSALGVSGTTPFETERRRVMKKYFSGLEILLYRVFPLALRNIMGRGP